MRGTTTAPAVAVAILLGFALAGCGGPGHPAGPPPSSPATVPASVTGTAAAAELARQAYLAMWAAYAAAAQTADYQSPALSRYAAGGALSVLTHGLYSFAQKGVVTRGAPALDPRVTMASGQQADVTDCADSSGWTEYTRSGQLASGQQPGRREITAWLQPFEQAGGTVWKVTYLNVSPAGTC